VLALLLVLVLQIDKPFQFEPGTITYRIALPRHPDDIYLCYGWDRYYTYRYRDGTREERSDGRRSCQTLNGEHDHKHHYPQFKNLAYGRYVAFVQIYAKGSDLDHPRLVETTVFTILKIGDDP
jgi:hypothetical protein